MARATVPTDFVTDPATFLADGEAQMWLQNYFDRYTGSWFERLADEDPYRFTERDLVAVSTLAVDIPAPTSIWLLTGGAAEASALLKEIPPEQAIWDDTANLSREGAAWRLWNLVRAGGWPERRGGMGPTKTSKLLSAKRPHLVPIQDSVATKTLFGRTRVDDYWAAWRRRLSGPAGVELRASAELLRDAVPAASGLSVLRVLDIVVWMGGSEADRARRARSS